MSKIRVTIWNEFRHEKTNDVVRSIYPEGLHAEIGKALFHRRIIDRSIFKRKRHECPCF